MQLRAIPGFPGYSVTDTGIVLGKNGRALRPSRAAQMGYQLVHLYRNGGRISRYVHRLVLETFVGPPQPKQECRHLNGNHLDNRAVNLAWGTRQENIRDRARHKTNTVGVRNPQARLTPDSVKAIRLLCQRRPQHEVARLFGVSQTCISHVITRKTWRHV